MGHVQVANRSFSNNRDVEDAAAASGASAASADNGTPVNACSTWADKVKAMMTEVTDVVVKAIKTQAIKIFFHQSSSCSHHFRILDESNSIS